MSSIVTRDFFRFVETASAAELIVRKQGYEVFLQKLAGFNSDYSGEARAAIGIIDEEMVARASLADASRRKE